MKYLRIFKDFTDSRSFTNKMYGENKSEFFFCLLIAIPKNEEHDHLTAVYKNLEYPENMCPNWRKLGSFTDKHHILHLIDFIFGYNYTLHEIALVLPYKQWAIIL